MKYIDLEKWLVENHLAIPMNYESSLEEFKKLLYLWNDAHNLTRVPKEQFYSRHILDSIISLAKFPELFNSASIIDIGTGAGFPGLPLAMLLPNCKFTLVDSVEKKITFISAVLSRLGLTNVTTVHSRIEDYSKDHKSAYDLVIVRALASLKQIEEWSRPLLKDQGCIIALKGNDIASEITQVKYNRIVEYALPDQETINQLVLL